MRSTSLVERIRRASDALAFLAPLATRVVLGLAFLQTGLGKWRNFDNTIQFFASLGLPAPTANAALVATLELVGGIALILGLGTRFFALGLSSTMVVALLTADRADFLAAWAPASDKGPTDIVAFAFLLWLLWLVFYGAGTMSLDRLVSRFRTAGAHSVQRATQELP